jgi:hypothetical protein
MAKTFSVRLEIEEVALGTVLRKLHDMPGIAKLDLDFGEGGKGAGREKLQQQAAVLNTPPVEAVLKALANGPLRSRDLIKATGMKDHRVYYAIGKLGDAVRRNADGALELAALALPAPTVKRRSDGRATPGRGPEILRASLASSDTPLSFADLRNSLKANGMSGKSVNGVLDRAKRDGIIKKTKDGYTLTAKAMNGAAHG